MGRDALAIAIVVAAAGPFAPGPAGAAEQPRTLKISDERSVTRWAHATGRAPVRRAPRTDARVLARLRFYTEDRHPEVFVALKQHVDSRGREWIKVRVPMRPRGAVGWVPRRSLGLIHTVRTRLVVHRGLKRAWLLRDGRRVWRAPVGVGAPGTPTPGGRFYIREVLRDFRGGTIYGPVAFGTSAYSGLTDWPGGGVIGIHGTNQPQLIPGRPSHGCIRVRNRAIRRLARLMPVGTPVEIR